MTISQLGIDFPFWEAFELSCTFRDSYFLIFFFLAMPFFIYRFTEIKEANAISSAFG